MDPVERVVVAMSGGVDSSVSAALLLEKGYDVIGMMLRLWNEPGSSEANRCCSPDSIAMARRICSKLEIPFFVIDAQEVFYNSVVSPFIEDYAQGLTPNPCLACNRQIRWTYLLSHALTTGAKYMATGHYARIRTNTNGLMELHRAVDESKDQSYVLHVLNQNQLKQALFPLGDYTKEQVRQLARRYELPVADKADSQDLCFLGNSTYQSFLLRQRPDIGKPGPIKNLDGEILGTHQGLMHFTIGQRKGLGIPTAKPNYVIDKIAESNTLVVGEINDLGKDSLQTHQLNWISGSPPDQPINVLVKIRYKSKEISAILEPTGQDRALLKFDSAVNAITPGQAAVFYNGSDCLGGGIIL